MIVDAWDIQDRGSYREIPRLGRKVRMAAGRRDEVWEVFEHVRSALAARGATTEAALMHALANGLDDRPLAASSSKKRSTSPFPNFASSRQLLETMSTAPSSQATSARGSSDPPFGKRLPASTSRDGRLKVNYRNSHQGFTPAQFWVKISTWVS